MGHFKYQDAPTDGLPSGATTVMIRGLVRSTNLEDFIRLLHTITEDYDLIYVPVGNKHSTNLGLAFVNYVDEDAARTGFSALSQARGPQTFRLVKSAYVQGFCPNLAFILASGDDTEAVTNHHDLVMAIFRGGRRVKDVAALMRQHVTAELLSEARVLLAKIESQHRRDSFSTDSNASSRFGSYQGSSAGRSSTARSVRQSASQESSRSMRSQSDRNSRRNHGSQAAAPKTGPQPNADEEFRYKNAPGAWFDESFAAYSEHPYVMQPMPMQAPHLGQPCMQHHEMLNMGQPFQAQVQQAHLQQAHMQQAQQVQLQQTQQQMQLRQLQMQQNQMQRALQMQLERPQLQSQHYPRHELYQDVHRPLPQVPVMETTCSAPYTGQGPRLVFDL